MPPKGKAAKSSSRTGTQGLNSGASSPAQSNAASPKMMKKSKTEGLDKQMKTDEMETKKTDEERGITGEPNGLIEALDEMNVSCFADRSQLLHQPY